MRPGGGKAKGSEFERDICKKLSRWVSHGEREDLFWRSAMSGGRATVGKKKGLDHAKHAGDISATHPLGHNLTDKFYIECKYYADLKFDSWILNGEGPLAGFWKVAREQAAEHKLMPMLIVKQNRSEVFLIVPAPYILSPGSAGISAFNQLACIARVHRQAKADIYLFDSVMVKPFQTEATRRPFLKAGELVHILATPGKSMSAKGMVALKSVVSAATKSLRQEAHERVVRYGTELAIEQHRQDVAEAKASLPKTGAAVLEKVMPDVLRLADYYEMVDKWVHTKRRRDGVKKRMMQEEPDGAISDTARAPAKEAKPVRIKV